MEKFLKNPLFVPVVVAVALILLVAFIWDDKKNPKKDFFGVLKSETPAV